MHEVHPRNCYTTPKRKERLAVDHTRDPPLLAHDLLFDAHRRWLGVMMILSIR